MLLPDFLILYLTVRVEAAEDAEKTAVFHYSKVIHVTSEAPLFDQKCLTKCNIITSHSLGTVPIWRGPGACGAERTV